MFNFIRRLDAECDDEILKALYREYGYMLQIGTAFVNLRPKWWLFSIIQVILYLAFIFYFEYLLITTTIIFSQDLNSASESAHFCVLGVLMLIIIVNYPLKRRNFIDLMRIVADNYFEYKDSYKSDSVEMWKVKTRKLKASMLVLVTGYFIVVLLVKIFIAPLIDQYQGYDSEDYIEGVYMKIPIPVWLPYQIDSQTKQVLTLVTEAIGGSMLISVIIGADLILIFQSVDIILQMRILRDSIKHLEMRAMLIYNKWNGTSYEVGQGDRPRRGDASFMNALNYCIKQNAQHHRIISRAFYNIYDLGSVPLAAAFLIGSAIIALSLFNFATSNKLRIGPQIFSLMLLIAEVCNMALICFVGQELSDLSEGVYYDLYDIDWLNWNKNVNRSIMIMKENLKRPLSLMAGGIFPINRNMFASIINTAYSYLNLLLAASSADK